jgi:hypothetical protein
MKEKSDFNFIAVSFKRRDFGEKIRASAKVGNRFLKANSLRP